MPSHSISVTVENDSIRVQPETLTMTAEDDVQWRGTNARQFSLVFDDEGAFGSRELDHSAATRLQRPRARGRFKYSIVSSENPDLKLDPVVIVDDPPSNPNP